MSVYETHIIKDPQLPFFIRSSTKLNFARHAIPLHWHENIEIVLVTAGEGVINCDTRQLRVKKDDIVVVNSNYMHGFSTDQALFSYAYLIVDRSFCIANYFDTNLIRFQELFQDAEIVQWIQEICLKFDNKENSKYRVQMIRAMVLKLMVKLCMEYSTDERAPHVDSHLLSRLKQAIGYIRSESNRDLSLDEVADFAGLSKFYFAREFHRITGNTFVSYLNLVRCENAKKMLIENQKNIGEIARACGFENQSYFTRRFRSYTGMLPSDYREKHIQKHKADCNKKPN